MRTPAPLPAAPLHQLAMLRPFLATATPNALPYGHAGVAMATGQGQWAVLTQAGAPQPRGPPKIIVCKNRIVDRIIVMDDMKTALQAFHYWYLYAKENMICCITCISPVIVMEKEIIFDTMEKNHCRKRLPSNPEAMISSSLN